VGVSAPRARRENKICSIKLLFLASNNHRKFYLLFIQQISYLVSNAEFLYRVIKTRNCVCMETCLLRVQMAP